jgi:hypothetical protein
MVKFRIRVALTGKRRQNVADPLREYIRSGVIIVSGTLRLSGGLFSPVQIIGPEFIW